MTIKLADFDLYKDLLYEKSGLVITPDKTYLLDSRLTPVARKWNYTSLDALTVALRAFPDPKLINDIIEAMTTNETSFFRDIKPFQMFEATVLPALVAARNKGTKKIRIWCAASSTGQEPYSLCMLLKDKEALWRGISIEIVATDISHEVLDIARAGSYSQFEVQRGLPIQNLMKYFKQAGDRWQLSDDIRKMVRYDYFNLLGEMRSLGQFDVIFCRNVLIYFDDKTKGQVMAKMAGQLAADGYLFLGGAETVLGVTDKFKPLENQRGLYVKLDHPALAASGKAGASGGATPSSPASGTTLPPARPASSLGTSGSVGGTSSPASPTRPGSGGILGGR